MHNKKTIILLAILCIALFSAFASKANTQQSSVDWSPTFHHDWTRTGYSTSPGPLTNQTLWSYATGNSIEYTSPAVVDGVVYAASHDNNVYALDAENGSKIWSFKTGNSVESSPSFSNGVVYVSSNDHYVYALNAENGTKVWSYITGNSVNSCPAVTNSVVYVGSTDHSVYALNAVTGIKIWSYQTNNEVESSPSISNGIVYVGSLDSNIYAFGSNTTPQSSADLISPSPSPSIPEFPTWINLPAFVVVIALVIAAINQRKKAN